MTNLITVGMRQKWLKNFKRDVLAGEPFSRGAYYGSDSKLKEQMKNAELRN